MTRSITIRTCILLALITALHLTAIPSDAQADSDTHTAQTAVVQRLAGEKEPPPDEGAATDEGADEQLAGRRKSKPGKGILQ